MWTGARAIPSVPSAKPLENTAENRLAGGRHVIPCRLTRTIDFRVRVEIGPGLVNGLRERLPMFENAILQHHERYLGVSRRVRHGQELLRVVEVSSGNLGVCARIENRGIDIWTYDESGPSELRIPIFTRVRTRRRMGPPDEIAASPLPRCRRLALTSGRFAIIMDRRRR